MELEAIPRNKIIDELLMYSRRYWDAMKQKPNVLHISPKQYVAVEAAVKKYNSKNPAEKVMVKALTFNGSPVRLHRQ